MSELEMHSKYQISRTQLLLLALLWTFVIIQGSLFPFDFAALSINDAWELFRESLKTKTSGGQIDSLSNILLFLPTGFLWAAVFSCGSTKKPSKYLAAFGVILLASLFGTCIEFVQVWLPERTSSARDIYVQMFGTSLGIAIWFSSEAALTKWISAKIANLRPIQPIDRFLRFYLIGFLYYQIHPFDFTIHPVDLYHKVARGSVSVVPFENWLLISSDGEKLARHIASYIPIGALTTVTWTRRRNPVRSFERSVFYGFLVAALVELMQFFTESRYADATDILCGTAGAAIGVLMTLALSRVALLALTDSPTDSRTMDWRRWGTAFFLMFIAVVATYWRPFELSADEIVKLRESIRAEILTERLTIENSTEVLASSLDSSLKETQRLTSQAGVGDDPTIVPYLRITEPGVYENYVIDGNWNEKTLVKIAANGVILRHCEIRNAKKNAITVYAQDVVIDACHIHHVLQGNTIFPEDAHGITGCPKHLLIKDCNIHHVSGDCIQFDPARRKWGNVVIKNCQLWTDVLDQDTAGFKRGDRPGENAIDTKASPDFERGQVFITGCWLHGWKQGKISNMAALNIKENVAALITDSTLEDNEISFRLRGPTRSSQVGAQVSVRNCQLFSSNFGFRLEDKINNLKISDVGFGPNVERKIHIDRNKIGYGYETKNLFDLPARK